MEKFGLPDDDAPSGLIISAGLMTPFVVDTFCDVHGVGRGLVLAGGVTGEELPGVFQTATGLEVLGMQEVPSLDARSAMFRRFGL